LKFEVEEVSCVTTIHNFCSSKKPNQQQQQHPAIMFANTLRNATVVFRNRNIISSSLKQTLRKSSHAPIRDGVYRPKSTKEVWTGDAGAYSIIFGIGWCLFFGTAFSAYYFISSPDVRVFGRAREKLFRGDLNEYTRE